jgi:hypothetical protein
MTRPMEVPVFSRGQLWHTLAMSQALEAAGVEAQQGLSAAEVAVRAERFRPNKFAEIRTILLRRQTAAELVPADGPNHSTGTHRR